MSTPITSKTHATTNGRARGLPLVVAFAILALGSMAATQLVASALSYQAALGPPVAHAFGLPIYQPLSWLKWFLAFRTIDHPVLDAAFVLAARTIACSLAAAAVAAIFLRYLMTRDLQKVKPDLHGTAHWMSAKDIHGSGLVGGGAGVYIGGWTEKLPREIAGIIKWTKSIVHYLRHNGPEHILVFAPTRSGKGVGLVLPTLLSWEHSALVYDIKGEAWALTSGWRRLAGQKTLRFDPADPSGTSVCYNPLEEVRIRTIREVGDVQNLVTMIVDPDGKGLNDHWQKTGHALLVGAVLHVLYSGQKKTLAGVAEFLSDPSRTFEDALNDMLETEHDDTGIYGWEDSDGLPTKIHPTVAASARDMLNKAEQERSGVHSTSMSFLTLYRDPIVAMNTRCSQFKISDLMNHESPVTLYLVVRPSDQARLKPLTRLLINQVVRGLTEEMKFKEGRSIALYKHRLLLLMDEFPSLGKLEIFEEALAFMAGYGMKAYLITQDLAQLQKHYTREEAITSNCHIRVAFAPNKFETAKMLSDMVGTTTVVKSTYSYSGKRSKTTLDSVSAQASEHSRQLLTPDEIMRLRGPKKDRDGNITEAGDMLIFQAGFAPIMGTQILYFRDPTFHERSLIEAPAESDRVRGLSTSGGAAPPSPTGAPGTPPPAAASHPAAPVVGLQPVPDDEHEDSDEDADYEAPPLIEAALIQDHEEYPEAYDVPIDPEEEVPPLGQQITLSPEELAALPSDSADVEDDDGDEDPPQGAAAELTEDPFLALSRQWSEEPLAEVDMADLHAEVPAGADSALELAAGAKDPFLAASRSWAGPQPPDTASLGLALDEDHVLVAKRTDGGVGSAFPQLEQVLAVEKQAVTATGARDDFDGFALLTAMAEETEAPRP